VRQTGRPDKTRHLAAPRIGWGAPKATGPRHDGTVHRSGADDEQTKRRKPAATRVALDWPQTSRSRSRPSCSAGKGTLRRAGRRNKHARDWLFDGVTPPYAERFPELAEGEFHAPTPKGRSVLPDGLGRRWSSRLRSPLGAAVVTAGRLPNPQSRRKHALFLLFENG